MFVFEKKIAFLDPRIFAEKRATFIIIIIMVDNAILWLWCR